jgi:hypothetical protein
MTRSLHESFLTKICNEIRTFAIFRRFGPVLPLAFPNVRTALEDYRISDFDELERHATTILKSIPEMNFEKCREQGNTDPLEVCCTR